MADANKSKKPSLAFKWTVEMVHDLLDFLLEYKREMEYNDRDFNAEKVQQYEAIRAKMAEKYSEAEGSMFGHKKTTSKIHEQNTEPSFQDT